MGTEVKLTEKDIRNLQHLKDVDEMTGKKNHYLPGPQDLDGLLRLEAAGLLVQDSPGLFRQR